MIPIPSGGPGMVGDFPPFLDRTFNRLKVSLVLMMMSAVGTIIFSILTFGELTLTAGGTNSLRIIFNALIGIWMLKQDPTIGQMYNFLATTCCGPCAEPQCRGGLGCLMYYMFSNGLTVLFNISSVIQLIKNLPDLLNPTNWPNDLWGFYFVMFAFCVLSQVVTQIAGICFGYSAYRQARDNVTGLTISGGEWATSGGSAYQRGEGRGRQESQLAPPRQNNFQAFGGSGQRLGG